MRHLATTVTTRPAWIQSPGSYDHRKWTQIGSPRLVKKQKNCRRILGKGHEVDQGPQINEQGMAEIPEAKVAWREIGDSGVTE